MAWRPFPSAVWWGILYLGVVSTALAFYLWNKGFTLLDASTGSLFFFAQPVVGAVLGWLLLGESPDRPLPARDRRHHRRRGVGDAPGHLTKDRATRQPGNQAIWKRLIARLPSCQSGSRLT